MWNFYSGNLPFGFFNQLQFKPLIHESFIEINPSYRCMTAKRGFSEEMQLWLVYLGEHSCRAHIFYCAHIFYGKFCLFFLFSCRINQKKNPEREKEKDTAHWSW